MRAGVDDRQWRALLRAYLLIDHAAALGAYGKPARRQAIKQIAIMWLFFPLAAASPAAVILLGRDVLFGATLMCATTMLMVGMIVLGQAASLIAPDDLAIVGFRPVSSRTYLAARVAGLIRQAAEIGFLTGWPCVLALLD